MWPTLPNLNQVVRAAGNLLQFFEVHGNTNLCVCIHMVESTTDLDDILSNKHAQAFSIVVLVVAVVEVKVGEKS